MRRIARHGRAVLQLPHDRAVLADARVAAHGPQRHVERDGDGRRVRSRLPGDLHSHPVRERVHLRGARRARLQHVLHRQVAPDAGRGVQPGRLQGPVAARSRVRAVLRMARRRDELLVSRTSSTTTTRSTPPATPEEGYHLADDLADKAIEFIRDAKVVDPDKPFFLYLAPQAGHAPHHVPKEWADKYKGKFDDGLRGDPRRRSSRARRSSACCPRTPSSRRSTRTASRRRTGPDGQPWPLLDTVRPWDSLSDDEQRLFARMAEVFAGYISYYDDQLGRVIDYLEESGQLDNTIIVVISDNGASGEGGPNGSFNEWRFFNGHRRLDRRHAARTSTSSARPQSYNHYNTGWAWAFDTPFPYWKRWAGYEGGVADMCMVSWPAQYRAAEASRATSTSTPSTSSRRSTSCSASSRPTVIKGYQQSPIEGESFAASLTDPKRARQGDAVLRDARPALDLPPGLAGLHRCTRPSRAGATSTRTCGSSTTSTRTAPRPRTSPTRSPSGSSSSRSCGSTTPGSYNGLPLDDRTALEQVLAERPHAAAPRDRSTSTTPTAPTCPRRPASRIDGRSYTIAAGVTVDSADAEGVSYAHGGVAGGHSLYVKDRRLHYAFNWVGTPPAGHRRATATSRRGSTSSPPSSPSAGQNDDPAMPGFAGPSPSTWTTRRSAAARSSPSRARSAWSATASASGATARRRSHPTTRAPFRFTGGTIDKVVVDVSGEQLHRPRGRRSAAGSSRTSRSNGTKRRGPDPVNGPLFLGDPPFGACAMDEEDASRVSRRGLRKSSQASAISARTDARVHVGSSSAAD